MDTPYGFPMMAGPFGVNRMMQEGTFEPAEIALVRQLLARSDVFVDVGANIGLYTCVARSLGKHAIAIEPQNQNLSLLYSNLKLNGWNDVEVFPLGVAEKPGLLELYGASGPSASLIRGWAGYSQRYRQTIATCTLDTLLGSRFAGRKLLIKIDVEGAEYQVLLGAQQTIARSPRPTWLVEICLSEFHPGGVNPHFIETFELFWQHGYETHWASGDKRRVDRQDIADSANRRP